MKKKNTYFKTVVSTYWRKKTSVTAVKLRITIDWNKVIKENVFHVILSAKPTLFMIEGT